MKKHSLALIISLLLCCIMLTACVGKEDLPPPVNLGIDYLTDTLYWDKVSGASGYKVNISGREYDSDTVSYSLANLNAGTYSLKVKAVGGLRYNDSEWSEEIPYTKLLITSLRYKRINGDTEYEVEHIGTESGDIVVKDMHQGLPVTRIGESAFSNRNLLSITIGSNIKSIGRNAFFNSGIKQIYFTGDGKLEIIDDFAFQNCRSLKEIEFPDSLKSIGKFSFDSCRGLTKIDIPDSVISLGEGAFSNCNELLRAYVGDGVTTIENNAFRDCALLRDVMISDNVTSIGEYAFSGCPMLNSFTVPANVTNLGTAAFAFSLCANPGVSSSFIFASGSKLTSIGDYAFYGCSTTEKQLDDNGNEIDVAIGGLDNITIPAGVTNVGRAAFTLTWLWEKSTTFVFVGRWLVGCKNIYITTIAGQTFRSDTYGIAKAAFFGFRFLFDLTIPSSVETIGANAFQNCLTLTVLSIPSTQTNPSKLTTIGESAFAGCADLTAITLPNSVTTIGLYAFYDCVKLAYESTFVGTGIKKIGAYAFYNTAIWNGKTNDPAFWDMDWNPYSAKTDDGIIYVLVGNSYTYRPKGMDQNITVYWGAWVVGVKEAKNTVDDQEVITLPEEMLQANLRSDTVGIADQAFIYCSELRNVTLPQANTIPHPSRSLDHHSSYQPNLSLYPATITFTGIRNIGRAAFYACQKLGSVVIPSGVTIIDDLVFYACYSLLSVQLLGRPTSIGDRAFYMCPLYQLIIPGSIPLQVTIGKEVTSIGYAAFYDCISPKIEFEADSKLTNIGDYAFYGAINITTVTIPDGVTAIGNNTFDSCYSLENIILGKGVTSIGSHAFYACSLLEEIVLSDDNKITSIGDYAFFDCFSLNSITTSTDEVEAIVIPRGITSIGQYVFSNCISASNVIIPDNVKTIGAYAFYGCVSLSGITIPDDVTTIGSYAFDNCISLSAIIIPKNVTNMGNHVFYSCDSLTIYAEAENIPEKWSSLWNASLRPAYFGVNELNFTETNDAQFFLHDDKTILTRYLRFSPLFLVPETITLNGVSRIVTGIGSMAFSGSSTLTHIIIPASIIDIGARVFDGCFGLLSITVSDENTVFKSKNNCLIRINDNTLIEAPGNRTIEVPDDVSKIGSYAFSGRKNLLNIILPNTITSIGDNAFYDCNSLGSITIPSSVKSIGDWAFAGCTALKKIVIPDKVVKIGDWTFYDCTSLETIILPANLTRIGEFAFYKCIELISIVLPNNIEIVDRGAFLDCPTLTVYAEAVNRPAGWSSDWNTDRRPVIWNCVLSVDKSYVVSLTRLTTNTISNHTTGISPPQRTGYTFIGWSISLVLDDINPQFIPDYTLANVNTVPNGTVLYAVWKRVL